MGGLFVNDLNALRPGWRAFLFYVAVACGYGLLHSTGALGLFVVLILLSWLFLALEARPLSSLGLSPGPTWARDFGLGLCAGAAIILLTAAASFLAGGFHLARAGGIATLATGALFYLVPALNEELGFRGYIFQRVEWGLGTRGALALMSVVFALAHLANPGITGSTRILAPLNILLAGVVLGLAYLGTRSLALPMGIHLGWNWAQGSLLGFGVSGTHAESFFRPVPHGSPLWLTGGRFGLEASLPCTVVCLVACLILARLLPPINVKFPFPKK